MLTAFAPLYDISIGLWRKNAVTVVLGALFLCARLANVGASYAP